MRSPSGRQWLALATAFKASCHKKWLWDGHTALSGHLRPFPADVLGLFLVSAIFPREDARAGGIVMVRQKPCAADGAMFITRSDETDVANLVG